MQRLRKAVDESFVKRGGRPDARRLALEAMTRALEPTAPPRTVSARLGTSEAMARTLEQLGLDPLDWDDIIHDAHERGMSVSHLQRLDRHKVLEMTLWEALEGLCRPKLPRGRPPAKSKR